MKIIREDTLEDFRKLRLRYPSVVAMAKDLGISDSMLSRILRGKTSHLADRTWKRLSPWFCPAGHSPCPIETGSKEFKSLVKTLIDINDPATYAKIEEYASDLRQKNSHEK